MTCTGKFYKWNKKAKFDMIIFGTKNKGLAVIEAKKAQHNDVWSLETAKIFSKKRAATLNIL